MNAQDFEELLKKAKRLGESIDGENIQILIREAKIDSSFRYEKRELLRKFAIEARKRWAAERGLVRGQKVVHPREIWKFAEVLTIDEEGFVRLRGIRGAYEPTKIQKAGEFVMPGP